MSFGQVLRLSNIAVGVQCLLQERCGGRRQVHVSYVKRDTFGCIVQNMIESLIANPEDGDFYVTACKILSGLLYCQPLETLTQAVLQQCVAVATAPWMAGEVRLADLRIGETLAHKLVAVSHRLEAVLDGSDAARAIKVSVAKWR